MGVVNVSQGTDRFNGQAGIVVPSFVAAATTVNLAASVVGYRSARVYLPYTSPPVLGVRFWVTAAAGADDPCDWGLYDAAGNRICSTGAVTGQLNATGLKQIPFTTTPTLPPGVYYLLCASNAGAAPATLLAASFANNMSRLFGDMPPNVEMGNATGGAFPLPASIALPNNTGASTACPFAFISA